MGILSQDEILKLRGALISAGLADTRAALLAGMSPDFIASLPITAIPGAQVLSDLDVLNNVGTLSDGVVPLLVWLKNALALAGSRQEHAVFMDVLTHTTVPNDRFAEEKVPPLFTRAVALYKTGEKRSRIAADRLLEQGAAEIDYDWLLSLNSGIYGRYERASMAKTIGAHPRRDGRGLKVLLDALATAPSEGGVYSYRILTAMRKLLIEGLGGADPMCGCEEPRRSLAALDLLVAGTGSDAPAAAAHVKILLLKPVL